MKYLFCGLLLACSPSQELVKEDGHRLQVRKDVGKASGVSIESFGAIPDDGKDDSKAIQNAIDYALCNNESLISAGPGQFDLLRGVVIAKKCDQSSMRFATVHLIGHVPSYDSDQNLGKTTVFQIGEFGFGIAIQKVRNSTIQNIVFKGKYAGAKDIPAILRQPPGLSEKDVHSPQCAIAIDPFHKKTPKSRRYKNFDHWYEYNSNAGSSMLTISSCSFLDLEVAIANNPSLGVNNGDNIILRDSHVKRCHTLWACGQTQSRSNSIENIYSINIHTWIDGRSIGAGQGTPPDIVNCNIAGFTKYVFNLKSGFSGMNVYRSYMESIYSLGVSMMNVTSFEQSQMKFYIPKQKEEVAPFLLYSDGIVSFRDCSLEYFSNCGYPSAFFLKSKDLIIDACHLEGGLPVSDGYTNRGGERIHNVSIRNSNIECKGATAGKSWYVKPQVNTKKDIILGGEMQITTEGDTLRNVGNTFHIESMGKCTWSYNSSNQATLTINDGHNSKVGDNLFSEYSLNLDDWGMAAYNYRPCLGFIKSINGNTMTIGAALPKMSTKSLYVYSARWTDLNSNLIQVGKRK